jgi:hypothetical protein
LVQSVGWTRIGILSGWSSDLRAHLEQEQAKWHTTDELAQLPRYYPAAPVCSEYDKGDCASFQAMDAAEHTVDPAVTASPILDHRDPSLLASLAVSAAPAQPGSAELWLQHHQGRWQRSVTLIHLQHHSHYNNMTGWVDLEQLDDSAGGLPVYLEHLDRSIQVNFANLFLVNPTLALAPPAIPDFNRGGG